MQLQAKVIEIRDTATCIPAIAIRMLGDGTEAVEWAIHFRSGYPRDGSGIVLMRLEDQKASSEPYCWEGRTMIAAHEFVCAQFDKLEDGQVVDVRVLLEETELPVASDRYFIYGGGRINE